MRVALSWPRPLCKDIIARQREGPDPQGRKIGAHVSKTKPMRRRRKWRWKEVLPYSACMCFGKKERWQAIGEEDEEPGSDSPGVSVHMTSQ